MSYLKEENKQTMETEDLGLVKEKMEDEKVRDIKDVAVKEVVKDMVAEGGDKSLQVSESVSIDKEENRRTGQQSHAMELKEHSMEMSVEDMTEKEDQDVAMVEMDQVVEKVASGSNRGEEKLIENLKVGQIRRKHNQEAEDKQKLQGRDGIKCADSEAKEPDSKKKKVIAGDKKLMKKLAKKAKGEKRRVRQRRAKLLRSSFLSSQRNINALQCGGTPEQETAVAIKELKGEVLVIGQSTEEINRKLEISLLNQAKLEEEIAGFRKSFEDKMVEELDEQKAKIGVLQQLIRNKEEVVLEQMKEKSEIEAALDKLASIGKVETGKVAALEAASEKLEEEVKEQKDKEEKLLSKLALIEKEKEMEIEGKHNMEAEVAKMKSLLQRKEEELQEMIKKDVAMPSTSGNFQDGLRKKILKTLNSGSAADIAELPTIGGVTALKVVAMRQKKGTFADVGDLKALGYGFYVKFVKANHLDL